MQYSWSIKPVWSWRTSICKIKLWWEGNKPKSESMLPVDVLPVPDQEHEDWTGPELSNRWTQSHPVPAGPQCPLCHTAAGHSWNYSWDCCPASSGGPTTQAAGPGRGSAAETMSAGAASSGCDCSAAGMRVCLWPIWNS